MSIQRQCPGVHGSFFFLQKSAAILDAVPVNEFFGTKFLFFFMHAPVIHFPVSFGVRLRAANIRGALSNLKKTGIIADGRGMRVRKMKFCDRMR